MAAVASLPEVDAGSAHLHRDIDFLIFGYLQRRQYNACLRTLLEESPHLRSATMRFPNGNTVMQVNDCVYERNLEAIVHAFVATGRFDVPPDYLNLAQRMRQLANDFSDLTAVHQPYSDIQMRLYGKKVRPAQVRMVNNPGEVMAAGPNVNYLVQPQTVQLGPLTQSTPRVEVQGNTFAPNRTDGTVQQQQFHQQSQQQQFQQQPQQQQVPSQSNEDRNILDTSMNSSHHGGRRKPLHPTSLKETVVSGFVPQLVQASNSVLNMKAQQGDMNDKDDCLSQMSLLSGFDDRFLEQIGPVMSEVLGSLDGVYFQEDEMFGFMDVPSLPSQQVQHEQHLPLEPPSLSLNVPIRTETEERQSIEAHVEDATMSSAPASVNSGVTVESPAPEDQPATTSAFQTPSPSAPALTKPRRVGAPRPNAMKPEDSPLMNASVRHEARNVPSTAGYENMSPNLNSYFEKQQRLQAEKRRPKDDEEKRRRESEKERERQKEKEREKRRREKEKKREEETEQSKEEERKRKEDVERKKKLEADRQTSEQREKEERRRAAMEEKRRNDERRREEDKKKEDERRLEIKRREEERREKERREREEKTKANRPKPLAGPGKGIREATAEEGNSDSSSGSEKRGSQDGGRPPIPAPPPQVRKISTEQPSSGADFAKSLFGSPLKVPPVPKVLSSGVDTVDRMNLVGSGINPALVGMKLEKAQRMRERAPTTRNAVSQKDENSRRRFKPSTMHNSRSEPGLWKGGHDDRDKRNRSPAIRSSLKPGSAPHRHHSPSPQRRSGQEIPKKKMRIDPEHIQSILSTVHGSPRI